MSDLSVSAKSLYHLLLERHMTMTAAESCTGGLIAKIMTDMAGSSEVFWGGFITYSNDSKEKLIGVPAETLEHFGAVSDETVRAMAEGALKRSTADCSLAVSGIAGPGGGTAEKPVGTVWIGVALKKGTVLSRIYHFEGDRAAIRGETAKQAISMLIDLISHIDY